MVVADAERDVFRSAFGRGLTIVVAVLGGLGVVLAGAGGGLDDAVVVAPWLGLVVLASWACFWRPRVEVSDAGVTLVNVTRTITIAWPAIQDVDTQWALRLTTAYGRHAAWAAPAPGLRSAFTARRLGDIDDARVLGSPRVLGGGASGAVRPGDLADTSSGEAAALVRRRWARLLEAGHLADPVLEHERPAIRWHLEIAAAALALAALGVVTSLTVR